MRLSECSKNDIVKIINIDAPKDFIARLQSFGIVRGEEIKIKSCSLGKRTIEILVDTTNIALRYDEAKKIEVEK